MQSMEEVLIRRIRQRVPLVYLSLEEFLDNKEVSEEAQRSLLDEVQKISEHNPHYCKTFLKKLIEFLGKNDQEIIDDIYEVLAEVMPFPPLQAIDNDVITYSLIPGPTTSDDQSIILRENPNIISGLGTTGLRTWEASLFLTQYLIHYSSIENSDVAKNINNKTILELGSGTGLVGMGVKKYTEANKVILTDGDSSLIDKMQFNLSLNDLKVGDSQLKCQKLWWFEDRLPQEKVDTIIAADVTYDSDVIPSLIHTINEAMVDNEYGLVDVAYIAATLRNEDTLQTWEKFLNMGHDDGIWDWKVIDTLNTNKDMNFNTIWYPLHTPDILIYQINRRI